ncbi:MAG: putative phosphate ABC transporter, phosphate-binding component [Ignavibacteriae bacterium]|nr:MAG: putative phosphate ABC transporter, phosphate-binding component [Ignavibacteriota bacterium]
MRNDYFKILFFFLFLIGCQSGDVKESPTKGYLVIYASETVAPLAKSLAQRFEHIYTEAKIDVRITSAREAVMYLLSDSTELILLSRTLDKDEEAIVKKREMKIYNYEIAKGGFGIIVNKDNPIEQIRISQIDSLFKGNIKFWKELGWKSSNSKIYMYFPGRNSDVFDYFLERFEVQKLPDNLFTFSTTDSTIQFISQKTNAMGFVGINYYDTVYNNIKFLDVGDSSAYSDSLGVSGEYFSPAQAYVYKEFYPLRSNVYIYTNIKSVGLASGFVSFATGVQGQQVVLNNKLVPSTMPVRIIQLNRQEKK